MDHTKIIGLDTGDVWTGIATSDRLRMLAKPLTTVQTPQLVPFLEKLLAQESFSIAIIGNPITLRGTLSEQTKKVHALKERLEQIFPHVQWILWDERLTSKQAERIKRGISKEDKLHSHAQAAAFILQSYLDYYQQQRQD